MLLTIFEPLSFARGTRQENSSHLHKVFGLHRLRCLILNWQNLEYMVYLASKHLSQVKAVRWTRCIEGQVGMMHEFKVPVDSPRRVAECWTMSTVILQLLQGLDYSADPEQNDELLNKSSIKRTLDPLLC